MFINLNVRSHYSLLLSTLSIDDIVNFALKHKQKYVCLTDFNTLYGAVEFFDAAIKNGLVPIIGLEIFHQESSSNLVLIAKSNSGYKNLLKVSSFIMLDQPYNLEDWLNDVYVIVKEGSFVPKKAVWYTIANNQKNSIAMSEVSCHSKDDAFLLNVLQAIKNDKTLSEEDSLYQVSEETWYLSESQAKQVFSKIQLSNLEKLLESCHWDLNEFHTNLIKYPTPKKVTSQLYLQALCVEGLKKRFEKTRVIPKIYEQRLKQELDIINQMGYDDYFLIVYDFINFAKKNEIIVGPGRGSAVGSLVAYVLQITDVDPIKYNLIFERFLNPKRQTMPDIDTDIMDTRRDEVVSYLFNKYGKDHVAHIVTFQRMKAKMALRDVGRVLAIPIKEIDEITKLIGMQYDEDLNGAIANSKKLKEKVLIYPTLFQIATQLINMPRQVGTHAAGIVLSNAVLTDIIPVQTGMNNNPLSQFSMEYLERFGLLKMDLLGLRNLSILDAVVKTIKKTKNIHINLNEIPLDDTKTFNLLCDGDTNGIFQLESPGMRKTLIKMQPKTIEDISITSSLFRPGPQENIPTFIARRNKKEKTTFVADQLIPILKDTNGIIVYQEQVIQIAQSVAGFSVAQADIFRRAISKKHESELGELRKSFIDGAISNKLKRTDAEQIFEYIYNFANYGFNHSHAVAYSLIGYWLAYLKANYFLEFATILLSANSGSNEKIGIYVNEAKQKGVKVLAPDINLSQESFTIHKNAILFGFDAIKNIGNEAIKKILNARTAALNQKFENYLEALPFLLEHKVTLKMIESLIYAGAFDNFGFNRKTLLHNLKKASTLNDLKRSKLFATGIEIELDELNMSPSEVIEFNEIQAKTIGIYLQDHPFKKLKLKVKDEKLIDLRAMKESNENGDPKFGRVFVKINGMRKTTTKTNKEMAFLTVKDDTDKSSVTVWPQSFDNIKNVLKTDLVCLISVKHDGRGLVLMKLVKIYNETTQQLEEFEGDK
ncbi:DNA polymerase III subunit alpha [[Mycoplasma] testudinis]|uniref:DNA polymerase III subunit alpha n=1 Tax=[Mycoplasma] testudinis TaxID=33924 RepID=UPI000695BC4E|nr:DNA polymerase III subunit alpha [[Mycoplasma] testudinis]